MISMLVNCHYSNEMQYYVLVKSKQLYAPSKICLDYKVTRTPWRLIA